MAQQAAFSQIPDDVKSVRLTYSCENPIIDLSLPIQFIIHFHQAVLENNLAEITIAYESGWNKYTEKFYARTEWPEAELIAPLVNDSTVVFLFWASLRCILLPFADPIFLILYRELYYRHVYSRLQPNIDDRFHSYENSCELFNYLLSEYIYQYVPKKK